MIFKVGPPAVLGLAAEFAAEASDRYDSIGVGAWARAEAVRDSNNSIRVFETFFQVHRLSCSFQERKLLTVYYADLWLSGKFISLAKWATAYFLALRAGIKDVDTGAVIYRDPPPRPDWVPATTHPLVALFPSQSKTISVLRTRLTESTRTGNATVRSLNLAWSLLGLKSMFPSMWVDQVSKSLFDHAGLLSSSPPKLGVRERGVLETLSRSVALLAYDNKDIVHYTSLPQAKLSSSAGWVKMYDAESERWRTMKGTRSAQFHRLGGFGARELTSMSYDPRTGVSSFYNIPYQFDWREWDFSPRVSVVALQEPFKIRTISIADGPVTAASSPFQRIWHKTLKSLRPFELIGGERVAKVVGRFDFDDGRAFVSGDYSAATDRLSSTASRVIYDGLMRNVAIDPTLKERVTRSLFSSELDYSQTLSMFRDKVPEALLDSVSLPPLTPQSNGQLMGNILSFPILCLVNLGTWLSMVLEHSTHPSHAVVAAGLDRGYWTSAEINSFPVLINGDDILFKANAAEYQTWLDTTASFGLLQSVGKNYISDEFFTINSELYTRTGFKTRPWWGGFESDFMRLRQELRFETGMDVLHADPRRVLQAIQSFLRQSVSESDWPMVNTLWLEHHKAQGVLDYYSGLNWFIPLEQGGLGLDSSGQTYTVTYAQRKLAVKSVLNPDVARRYFPSVETSLVTEEVRSVYRRSRPTWQVRGDVVDWKGYKMVLDRDQPLRVMYNPRSEKMEICYAGYPTLESAEAKTTHVHPWLDHHLDGVRFDTSRIPEAVTRMLRWGLALSDKKLSAFSQLSSEPVYKCVRSRFVIPAREVEAISG